MRVPLCYNRHNRFAQHGWMPASTADDCAVMAKKMGIYMLNPIKTIFMNSLKIIIAPIVFLSIVTCFSQFKSIGELGRLGAKVMGMYCLTTVIAIGLGIALFFLFQPGERGFALSEDIKHNHWVFCTYDTRNQLGVHFLPYP